MARVVIRVSRLSSRSHEPGYRSVKSCCRSHEALQGERQTSFPGDESGARKTHPALLATKRRPDPAKRPAAATKRCRQAQGVLPIPRIVVRAEGAVVSIQQGVVAPSRSGAWLPRDGVSASKTSSHCSKTWYRCPRRSAAMARRRGPARRRGAPTANRRGLARRRVCRSPPALRRAGQRGRAEKTAR